MGFIPAADRHAQDVRPGSEVICNLLTAGSRSDITNRVIVTTNPKEFPGFFPCFEGKTWEKADDGRYRATFDGDSIVALGGSALPGILFDILTSSPE